MSRLKTLQEYVDKELSLLEEEKRTSATTILAVSLIKKFSIYKGLLLFIH